MPPSCVVAHNLNVQTCPLQAVEAAAAHATSLGYTPLVLSSDVEGEAKEVHECAAARDRQTLIHTFLQDDQVGRHIVSIAQQIADGRHASGIQAVKYCCCCSERCWNDGGSSTADAEALPVVGVATCCFCAGTRRLHWRVASPHAS